MSFSALRKRKNRLETLKEKANAGNRKTYSDDRFWNLERDKAGNGFAIIRFLDVSKADREKFGDSDEVLPWAHYYTHMFKNAQGRWFSAKCRTSLGEECPVCQSNSELWDTGLKANQQTVRNRKRKEHYVSNIYVVRDSNNPENEGKTFLFRYGPFIFGMINDAMNPEFEDEIGFDPFDYWEGANFKLKARISDDYVKYDKSEFEAPAPLFDNDEEMEEVWSKSYSLYEFIDPEKYEDYDTVKKNLEKVIGSDSVPSNDVDESVQEDDEEEEKPKRTRTRKPKKVEEPVDEDDDDEDAIDYFRSKLEED